MIGPAVDRVAAMLTLAKAGKWRIPDEVTGGLRSVAAHWRDGQPYYFTRDKAGTLVSVTDAAKEDPSAWDWVTRMAALWAESGAPVPEALRMEWPRPKVRRGRPAKIDLHFAICLADQALRDNWFRPHTSRRRGEQDVPGGMAKIAAIVGITEEQVRNIVSANHDAARQNPAWQPLLQYLARGEATVSRTVTGGVPASLLRWPTN